CRGPCSGGPWPWWPRTRTRAMRRPSGFRLAPRQRSATCTVSPVSSPVPEVGSRRVRRQTARPRWDRFMVAMIATMVLVILFGAGPLELSGGAEAHPSSAAAVQVLGDDQPPPATDAT